MAKYSFELKKKIVKEYLVGKGEVETLAKKQSVLYNHCFETEGKRAKEKFGIIR